MLRKAKIAEVTFLAMLAALAGFMLWHAFGLEFVRRGTIGPGLYPALILGAIVIVSLVLMAKAVVSAEIRVLSPFPEGLRHDTVLRRLGASASRTLGIPVRIVSRTGSGRFSAIHAGRHAPPDGTTVTVVTSETADLPNLDAAPFCLDNFEPVIRLWYDPDILVVRPGVPWQELDDVFRSSKTARVGFMHHPGAAEPIRQWMARHEGDRIEPLHNEDGKELLRMLHDGRLDVAVVGLREAREDLGRRSLRCLGVLSDEPIHVPGAADGSTAVKGYPFESGRWGGLALPCGAADHSGGVRPKRLHQAFADASLRHQNSGDGEIRGESVSVLPPDGFGQFLGSMRDYRRTFSRGAEHPTLPRGKVEGLIAAAVSVFFFPQIMGLLGFPLAAFLFLSVLMTLLWPSPEITAALVVVPASAGLSLLLHHLFREVFYVVFPSGTLWGG